MNGLRKIIYDCKQATFLVEKKELTLREWLELYIHLAGCSFCRLFRRQSRMIDAWLKGIFSATRKMERHLDDAFKEALQDRIDKALKK